MMDLVRRVNSTYTQVNRNIEILEWESIVKTKRYGHMRVIQLNREEPKTEAILKALRILKHQEILEESTHLAKKKS